MIYEALLLVRDELGKYIEIKNLELNNNIQDEHVILDNVSTVEGNNRPELQNRIIISLVNLEEESALKNILSYQRTPSGLKVENPPIQLNLYLLFCTNFSDDQFGYQLGLQQLSLIVQFFQGNNIFTLQNSPNFSITDGLENPDLLELRLMLDLYTLTFEQINHLWGSLGGKQIPFVMYKARLVRVRDRRPLRSGEEIREIHSSEEIL